MTTITTLTDTNSGSVSMGVINTNFSNLNTDKIEATQTVALTNKTIDADLNTITDLTPTNIKTGNKTGLDTSIVTGTKGDANELAQWNSDGDLITTDVSITTTTPSGTSTNLTIPTSLAVANAISNATATKQIFVPALYWDTLGTSNPNAQALSAFPYTSLNNGVSAYFNFSVPTNFTTLTSAELVMIPDTTETITITQCTVDAVGSTETYSANTISTGSFTEAVTISLMTKVRLDTRTNTPFVNITAGDFVGVKITSGTTLIRVVGLLLKYA